MALTPSSTDDKTLTPPEQTLWETKMGSGWITVEPETDAELVLNLSGPARQAMDIHLAVRIPDGSNQHFAWCKWLRFNYLTASEKGI